MVRNRKDTEEEISIILSNKKLYYSKHFKYYVLFLEPGFTYKTKCTTIKDLHACLKMVNIDDLYNEVLRYTMKMKGELK